MSTVTGEGPSRKSIFDKFRGYYVIFIIICSVVGCVFWGVIAYWHNVNQSIIETHHREAVDRIYLSFKEAAESQNDTIRLLHKTAEAMIADSQEEIKSLLELQHSQLQNDFNFISIWAGLLTIVFLIFSIYSMFKTDEMQKQSKEILTNSEKVYSDIKKLAKGSEEKLGELEESYLGEFDNLVEMRCEQENALQALHNDKKEEFEEFFKTANKEVEGLNKKMTATQKEWYDKLSATLSGRIDRVLETDDSSEGEHLKGGDLQTYLHKDLQEGKLTSLLDVISEKSKLANHFDGDILPTDMTHTEESSDDSSKDKRE